MVQEASSAADLFLRRHINYDRSDLGIPANLPQDKNTCHAAIRIVASAWDVSYILWVGNRNWFFRTRLGQAYACRNSGLRVLPVDAQAIVVAGGNSPLVAGTL